jgi:hypothetical protein
MLIPTNDIALITAATINRFTMLNFMTCLLNNPVTRWDAAHKANRRRNRKPVKDTSSIPADGLSILVSYDEILVHVGLIWPKEVMESSLADLIFETSIRPANAPNYMAS